LIVFKGNANVGKDQLLQYYASQQQQQQQTDSDTMNYISQDLEIDGRSVTLQVHSNV